MHARYASTRSIFVVAISIRRACEADLITYHLDLPDEHDPVLFVVGKGNNGSNGIAAARHLIGRGRRNITVLLGFDPTEMGDMAREQLGLYERFEGEVVAARYDGGGLLVSSLSGVPERGIVVDGLLGTGISRPPQGNVRDLIGYINGSGRPVLALDVPSGLNHVTGEVLEPCIRATWTFNFHLLKSGQVTEGGRTVIGELWTADTDLTYTAWEEAGISASDMRSLYSTGPIRRVF